MYKWILRVLSGYATMVSHNWITMFGSSLVTASLLLNVFFLLLAAMRVVETAYLGILTFLVLPSIFAAGLVIIPFGVYWDHRRAAKKGQEAAAPALPFPVLDFNKARVRDVAKAVAGLTILNLLIIATVSYKGVVYSESTEFCGQICHTVMEPEYTAYLNSPHSKVHCVECHIGPGASWFAKSKLSGARQVFAVALKTYSRPIATPVHNLRPSKETCEECHWPAKFSGDRIRVIREYTPDEDNTLMQTVLLMHIGGGHGAGHGIHSWHIDDNKVTTYLAMDEERQEIGLVRVTDKEGNVKEYRAAGLELTEDEIANAEMRIMDCMDCHNRPSHIFRPPGKAVDDSMAGGAIDTALPYIKKFGVEALEKAAEEETGPRGVDEYVRNAYQQEYGDTLGDKQALLDAAIAELQKIFSQNVFPKMGVTWGTYANHIGHVESLGCFRCHDESHEAEDGTVISQDCNTCHTMLAWQEEDPEILTQLEIQ